MRPFGAVTFWGLKGLGLIVALLACAPASFAQATPPSGIAPSGGQTSRDVVAPPVLPVERPRPEITVRTDKAMPEEPCALENSPIRVKLAHIRFEAAGGADIAPALRPLLTDLSASESGDQPISVVCRIRDRVNGALAQAGFVARAQIPAQELQDGTLRLIVIAGRISEMRVHGSVGRFDKILSRRLALIQALNPFNTGQAVHLLLLANDIPGLKVQLALRNAGGAPGDLIGDVTVQSQSAVVLVNFQNYGSPQLGRENGTIQSEIYGLTGLADRTDITLSNTLDWREIHSAQIRHDMAIGNSGLRAGLSVNLAQSEPAIPNLDLQSRSFIGGVDVSDPLVRTLDTMVTATVGAEILNQATRLLGHGSVVPYTHDKTRIAFARIDGSYVRRGGDGRPLFHLGGYVLVRQGVDMLHATQTNESVGGFHPSRAEGDAQATVIRGELSAQWLPTSRLTIDAKLFGQYANNPLLNLEQFSIGNLTYGRGYDPGANGGDRAIAARIEPRFALGSIGDAAVDVSGFYDVVRIWNLESTAGAEAKRTFMSAGGSLRAIWAGKFALEVGYAKPFDKVLTSDVALPHSRVLVSLTSKLWPWGEN